MKRTNACLAALLVPLTVAPQIAARTYFIDESTDFTGNGCENTDLNTVTASLRSELDANAWSGSRFTNASAWPQDFVEGCSSSYGSGGLDGSYGDGALLTVYAGHGNRGLLQWGYARNGRCLVDFATNMRLGSMNGARGGYAVWITSCTLNTGSLVAKANHQWLRQQFGYHNSPSVKDNQPRDWFRAIRPSSNKDAWLNTMEDKPGWFTGDNSPIVVSYGENSDACWHEHNNKMLKGQVLSSRPGGPTCGGGQPQFWYCYTLRNNGASGC